MDEARILMKLAGPPSAFSAAAGVELEPLFTAPQRPPAGMAAGSAPALTWYRTTVKPGLALAAKSAHPWDLAHTALRGGLGLAGPTIVAVEPDLRQGWPSDHAGPGGLGLGAAERPCIAEGEKGAPFQMGGRFGWHLDAQHSGLRAARERVGAAGSTVTIVHLDTGYDPGHHGLPRNLDHTRERNLVEGQGPAHDLAPPSGILTSRGHGTGTIGILAGQDVGAMAGDPNFGDLGGTPHATVVPVRVADSVVHFWTSAVAQGIDYARQIGAQVLSMSMGGLPSASWADAVNAAYEAGVVLVCAAGNSFNGLPTSLIVYPARFDRVIAACGVMAQGKPYFQLGGPMEGCVGPSSKMATAMAAHTPNIPWLRLGCPDVADMDGAGTSSATPQVAAAAALWLAEHGHTLPADWRRVEAVRAALFGSTADIDPALLQFLGRGVLRAGAALDIRPDLATLQRTEADSASFAFLHLLTSVFGATEPDPRRLDMLRLELTQLALSSRGFREAIPEPHARPEDIPGVARQRAFAAILDEQTASLALREFLAGALGRPVPVLAPARTVPGAARPPGGSSIQRQIAIPEPTRRRLRVFATDPGDSSRLETAFVNLATIEVPWENLSPGPVGEYLEVVDVDPASGLAYPPVNLEERHLLAQDGIAPSEGNPQFHQQMVYAVAMRTIRNFEIALGRRALWAERRMPKADDDAFVPAPDRGYVQRLRLHPHALREQNAYYSPERKALLFGYFDVEPRPGQGRQKVFTCLSHDIIAHETTHALLDGLHRRFSEPTNPDVLAFHEAFADIVAIFQHFTFPELLRFEMAKLRGDLSRASILSDLARQFGQAAHNRRALRQAIQPGTRREDDEEAMHPLLDYRTVTEPHQRGAILVAAMFEAFAAIFDRQTRDLVRLATGGTGVLTPGAIHPDLVERLAQAAIDIAQRVLTIAIRALDYMPPVDPSFGDYLRAVVTADADMAPDHGMGYRVAFTEAFIRRGIYPADVASVSPDGLLWQTPVGPVQSARLNSFVQSLPLALYTQSDRRMAFDCAKHNAAELHGWLRDNLDAEMAASIGLDLRLKLEVHSVRPALRTTADGEHRTDIVAVITQRRQVPIDPAHPAKGRFTFRGGCTLLLDRGYRTPPIRYAISRPVWNDARAGAVRTFVHGPGPYGADARFGADPHGANEPFAALHAALKEA